MVEFAEVKKAVKFELAIKFLTPTLTPVAGGFRGPCPTCNNGDKRSLSITSGIGLVEAAAEQRGYARGVVANAIAMDATLLKALKEAKVGNNLHTMMEGMKKDAVAAARDDAYEAGRKTCGKRSRKQSSTVAIEAVAAQRAEIEKEWQQICNNARKEEREHVRAEIMGKLQPRKNERSGVPEPIRQYHHGWNAYRDTVLALIQKGE